MEEVEQFVSFMADFELKTSLEDIYEATGESHNCDFIVSTILNHCIDDFF
jgi:hypothetical protein